MHQALERAEQGIMTAGTDGDITMRRAKTWKLRLLGYTINDIADELGVSTGTAHADVRWCLDNYPPAYETADDFRKISLPQLDWQYRKLMEQRKVVEDGVERLEDPSEGAHRVALAVKDLIAKLLGAYAPREISGDITIKTVLEMPDMSEIR